MKIREATHKDIPQILKVLKASLGETSSKKTEEVWRYKHIDNPFGESLVLVAEESSEMVGVRAFMRWQWQQGEQVYFAFRAVDTATHPAHQGKGICRHRLRHVGVLLGAGHRTGTRVVGRTALPTAAVRNPVRASSDPDLCRIVPEPLRPRSRYLRGSRL